MSEDSSVPEALEYPLQQTAEAIEGYCRAMGIMDASGCMPNVAFTYVAKPEAAPAYVLEGLPPLRAVVPLIRLIMESGMQPVFDYTARDGNAAVHFSAESLRISQLQAFSTELQTREIAKGIDEQIRGMSAVSQLYYPKEFIHLSAIPRSSASKLCEGLDEMASQAMGGDRMNEATYEGPDMSDLKNTFASYVVRLSMPKKLEFFGKIVENLSALHPSYRQRLNALIQSRSETQQRT